MSHQTQWNIQKEQYTKTLEMVLFILKEGDVWEYLVEDGKPGAQGRAGAAGSGVGVEEVKTICNINGYNFRYNIYII